MPRHIGVPGRVRAGAGAVRVALGPGGGGVSEAAARAGQREPAADGPGHRQRPPGAARLRRGRRRDGVAAGVRVAEGHPDGGEVPAAGLLRGDQL